MNTYTFRKPTVMRINICAQGANLTLMQHKWTLNAPKMDTVQKTSVMRINICAQGAYLTFMYRSCLAQRCHKERLSHDRAGQSGSP